MGRGWVRGWAQGRFCSTCPLRIFFSPARILLPAQSFVLNPYGEQLGQWSLDPARLSSIFHFRTLTVKLARLAQGCCCSTCTLSQEASLNFYLSMQGKKCTCSICPLRTSVQPSLEHCLRNELVLSNVD